MCESNFPVILKAHSMCVGTDVIMQFFVIIIAYQIRTIIWWMKSVEFIMKTKKKTREWTRVIILKKLLNWLIIHQKTYTLFAKHTIFANYACKNNWDHFHRDNSERIALNATTAKQRHWFISRRFNMLQNDFNFQLHFAITIVKLNERSWLDSFYVNYTMRGNEAWKTQRLNEWMNEWVKLRSRWRIHGDN